MPLSKPHRSPQAQAQAPEAPNRRPLGRLLRLGGLALLLAATTALASCSGRQAVRRYDRTQLAKSLDNPDKSPLELGTFPLLKVIDGDTVKVGGLDSTLRLLAIDTEETFKKEKERRAFEQGWERYLAEAEAKSRGPVKIPTPLGEDAKYFALEFFKGVRNVHLELDHPKEVRGRFNRFLTYVFVDKGGERINYNVECVRAGMSPYFTKYGYSRRFHDEFIAAQDEARAAGRGIWDPSKQHYLDYDARLAWWNARADYIAAFEAEAEGRDDHIVLTHFDSADRLASMVGREVVILATIADIRDSKTGPTKVLLSRRMFSDFAVIFFDDEVFEATGMRKHKGEHVQVRGVVTSWYNKYKKREDLQIEVKLAGQVKLSPVIRPGRESDGDDRPAEPSEAQDDTSQNPAQDAADVNPDDAESSAEPSSDEGEQSQRQRQGQAPGDDLDLDEPGAPDISADKSTPETPER